MELLEGETLRQVVAREGPLPPARVLRVLVQACEALAVAHDEELIHRDVKPDNIMLCRQGGRADVVKLLDFGLVKELHGEELDLTPEFSVLGSPETMAPEMARGERVGPSADQYSLAAVGYYLLTGTPVFRGATLGALLEAHRDETPEPPSRRHGT